MKQVSDAISRKIGNMSIRAAAKEIGVSPTTFYRAKCGKTIDFETLRKVCEWAGENPGDYFYEADQQAPQKPMQPSSLSLAEAILAVNRKFIAEVDAEFH